MQISPGGVPSRKPTSPELRIAEPDTFGNPVLEQARMGGEYLELLHGPGKSINLFGNNKGKRRLEKEQGADGVPVTGIRLQDGKASVTDVPNPDRADGKWDPYQFMPRFVFEKKEDAFPVSPGFDGDFDMENNAPTQANQPNSHYKDGVIGGNQGLSAGFAVSQKGGYTVLSYSFYYATNKAVSYHNNDYSIAQVYLKPGKDGKLEPTHVYTSWHHGGELTPWKDMKKDDQGRPVIKIHQGSHATQPLGTGDKLPTEGFQLAGDGRALLDGKALPHTLGFEAFQGNIANADKLDPASPEGKLRLSAMSWGEVNFNPLMPELFKKPSTELLRKVEGAASDLWDKAKGAVHSGVERVKGFLHL